MTTKPEFGFGKPLDFPCSECGEDMRGETYGGEPLVMYTLVGFHSPEGHEHDDNCAKWRLKCPNGHVMFLSKRRRCPACEWVGKETCFCHPGVKVDEWPGEKK